MPNRKPLRGNGTTRERKTAVGPSKISTYSMEVPRAFGDAIQTVRKKMRTAACFMVDQLPKGPRRHQLKPALAALDVLMDDVNAFRALVDDLTNPKRVRCADLTSLTEPMD